MIPPKAVPILSHAWYRTLTAVTSFVKHHGHQKCDEATLCPRKAYFTDVTTGTDRFSCFLHSCATTQPLTCLIFYCSDVAPVDPATLYPAC